MTYDVLDLEPDPVIGWSDGDVAAFKSEIASLRQSLAEIDRESEKLRAELAECKRDAERYRWLRSDACNMAGDHTPLIVAHNGADAPMLLGDEADAAIDAALRGEGKP